MKEGLSLGQVGQRPFEMGYKTMMALRDMKDGKAPPPTRPTLASTSARPRLPTPASPSKQARKKYCTEGGADGLALSRLVAVLSFRPVLPARTVRR
jgi:hypothetical protein